MISFCVALVSTLQWAGRVGGLGLAVGHSGAASTGITEKQALGNAVVIHSSGSLDRSV